MSRTVPLAQLLPDVPGIPDVAVAGLALDSRELRPGDAFVAVAGFGRHGLHFAAQALAVLTEWGMASPESWDRLNVNGSGISLGHPVGATGVSQIAEATFQLRGAVRNWNGI